MHGKHIGENVLFDDVKIGGTDGTGRFHIFLILDRQGGGTHHTGEAGDGADGNGNHGVDQARP